MRHKQDNKIIEESTHSLTLHQLKVVDHALWRYALWLNEHHKYIV